MEIELVKEVLASSYEVIKVKERWTKNSLAKDIEGTKVMLQSPSAYCFCTLGIVGLSAERILGAESPELSDLNEVDSVLRYGKRLAALESGAVGILHDCLDSDYPESMTLASWNDSPETTHQMVVSLFEKALKRCDEIAHS